MIDVLVIPFGLVIDTGQRRYGVLGVLFLRGCELVASADVVHEAEYALADDVLVYGHVRLEVGNLLIELLDLGVRGVAGFSRSSDVGTGGIVGMLLLLTLPNEPIVLCLLVALGLLCLLVCGLGGGVLALRIAELRVRLVVCSLRGGHSSISGVDTLLSSRNGSLGIFEI